MEKQENNGREYYSIDVLHVFRTLWRRVWVIGICGVLAAAIGFSIAAFVIAPTYSSHVKLYVNNTDFSLGNFSISSSQLTAAQSLVRTYGEILDTRSTLSLVAEKSGLDYEWDDISRMLTYRPSNDTEIMLVVVTCEDPYHASKIAQTISEVLPVRIAEIIDGASMETVESAFPELEKIGPSITRYTAVGLILGILFSTVAVVVMALMDDTIHDEGYILRTYDYPILGKVPNLLNSGSRSYGYYAQNHRRASGRKDG